MRREAMDRDRVTETLKVRNDRFHSLSASVLENVWNVLKDKSPRPLLAKDVEHSKEQLSLERMFEAELLASLRERLTRKPGRKYIVIWDLIGDDRRVVQAVYIAPCAKLEVFLVE